MLSSVRVLFGEQGVWGPDTGHGKQRATPGILQGARGGRGAAGSSLPSHAARAGLPTLLHLSLAASPPRCHRVLLALALRGLAYRHVGIVQLQDNPTKARRGGWVFGPESPDPLFPGSKDLW